MLISHSKINVSGIEASEVNPITSYFNVYPNPFTNDLNIDAELEEETDVTVKIVDMYGREVINTIFRGNRGKNSYKLPMQELNAGIYAVALYSKRHLLYQKTILKLE